VKAPWLLLAVLIGLPAAAADEPKKPAAKKPAVKKAAVGTRAAHSKATPEQIRRFNDLQKKQEQKPNP
jgi:hypothetical protein